MRLLIVLNWTYGSAILALLLVSITNEDWTFTTLGVPPSPDTRPLVVGMRVIAVLGLVAIPLNDAVLKRLRATVETVRIGDPFVADNADRLQAMAWALLSLQVLSLVVGGIGKTIATPTHPLHLDAGFSVSGWLAVCLTFVLAKVFAQGTLMRDDLDGTV